MTPSTINGERVWDALMQMASIGATAKGGCKRLALSDEDQAGRELFLRWCREAGYDIQHDAVGNLFVRRTGEDNSLDPVVMGSHLDTQPSGGKFDGIVGVLAALEVLRSLDDQRRPTRRPIEIAVWTNEEGARFQPAMMGSGVYSGALVFEDVLNTEDDHGVSVAAELKRLGYTGASVPHDKRIHGYLELHIEQGPILEAENKSIGVVTGGQAIRWYDLTVTGEEAHAGPTPMELRKDPLAAVTRIMGLVFETGSRDPAARATIGQLQAFPGSRNVIPGRVFLTIDLRHPVEEVLLEMDRKLRNGIAEIANILPGLSIDLKETWHSAVVRFSSELVASVRASTKELGYSFNEMISGAGHDAFNVSRKAPTAMIFIPCRDGISHNEREYAEPEHVAAGTNVLLHAAIKAASV